MDFSWLVTRGLAGIAGVVWLVRLEGRINVLQSQANSAEKRVDGLETRIFERLDRIETKIDSIHNGK